MGYNGFGCGTVIRDLTELEVVYPACSGNPHSRGLVLASAWWQVRLNFGLQGSRVLHADWSLITIGGLEGGPGCTSTSQAAGPWTLAEALVADDDDGILANGTPNDEAICDGFAQVCILLDIDVPICEETSLPAACEESLSGKNCYADCDVSTGMGVLDIFDFLCFQTRFAKGDAYACSCDLSTGLNVCDVFDFLCFQMRFVEGCP